MKKTAYFFGAGAECSYGLPSGGQFALDLFRYDSTIDKEEFKKRRDRINRKSVYANDWLPDQFDKKAVSSFGKSSLEILMKGSFENRNDGILDYLEDFDNHVDRIVERFQGEGIDIRAIFERLTGSEVGMVLYGQEIKLISVFRDSGRDTDQLFKSEWFSAMLELYQKKGLASDIKKHLRSTVKSLLELLIGSCGEKLAKRVNENVFEASIDTIDIFDDLGGIMELDYRNAGTNALEYIIGYGRIEPDKHGADGKQLGDFCARIIEDIISGILDYQELMDSNWRYLYSPQKDWAKFCKISIFLFTARRYISEIAGKHAAVCHTGPGYYHDILELDRHTERLAVGTTNYNRFISDLLGDTYYLNGCVSDMYDPYLNKIVPEDYYEHFTVPFMFTQSGIKPLTSVEMSRRYVELYDKMLGADVIVIMGFGFNSDDGHINGLFRALIEDEHKEVFILHYTDRIPDEKTVIREYKRKLRLSDMERVHLVYVDRDRCEIGSNKMWYEYLLDRIK